MKIYLKAFCLIGVIIFFGISPCLSILCNHNGPPGPNDPTPDPHRSHHHQCCNPNVLLECPCPDCETLFENKEELKSHIIWNHAGCHYALAVYVRGDSAEESCGGDYDDRHVPDSSDSETMKNLSHLEKKTLKIDFVNWEYVDTTSIKCPNGLI